MPKMPSLEDEEAGDIDRDKYNDEIEEFVFRANQDITFTLASKIPNSGPPVDAEMYNRDEEAGDIDRDTFDDEMDQLHPESQVIS